MSNYDLRSRVQIAPVCLFVCMFWFVGTADGQESKIAWKFKKGDSFQVQLVQESSTRTRVDQRETVINSDNTMVFDWKVTDVDDKGNATIEQSLKSIKLSVADPAVPAQAVRYDTSGENEDISKVSKKLLEQIRPLVGLKFNVTMDQRGQILAVELPDETKDTLNQLPETLRLRTLFSDQGLKDLLGASAVVLPEGKLKADDSWTEKELVPTPFGNFQRVRNYAYRGVRKIDDRSFGEFELSSTMEPANTNDQQDSDAGTLDSYQGSGKLVFDIEQGYFTSSVSSNTARTKTSYREKQINSEVTNRIEMTISKN